MESSESSEGLKPHDINVGYEELSHPINATASSSESDSADLRDIHSKLAKTEDTIHEMEIIDTVAMNEDS